MVGLFSRFSVSRNGHRRSQTSLISNIFQDEREVLPPDTEVTESTTVVAAMAITHHGIEDGRIWKERVCAGAQKKAELSTEQEGAGAPREPEPRGIKSQRRPNRTILPSISAPERNILKLLEECNASGGM